MLCFAVSVYVHIESSVLCNYSLAERGFDLALKNINILTQVMELHSHFTYCKGTKRLNFMKAIKSLEEI